MSENFSSISQVFSSPALEQKKHFEAILPRPDTIHNNGTKISFFIAAQPQAQIK
jgi:hypothetical protein